MDFSTPPQDLNGKDAASPRSFRKPLSRDLAAQTKDLNSTDATSPRNFRKSLSTDLYALQKDLNRKDEKSRQEFWRRLPDEHHGRPFSREDVDNLLTLLLTENAWEVRTAGMVYLDEVLRLPVPLRDSSERFHDWLFQAFTHSGADKKSAVKNSLVLTVCDDEYVRDVQALVKVARLLPSDSYPQTVFQHVALESPDWSEVDLDRAEAICLIGRPSMFQNCPIMGSFPSDLRFSIEKGVSGKKGDFSFVRQNRPKAGPKLYQTTQNASGRKDYAIVQRFVIQRGGRNVTVVAIAGATSLGTLGAAQWITEFEWGKRGVKGPNEYAHLAGLDNIESASRIEALLEVTAKVHRPPRPWGPVSAIQGLYLHRSRNLLKDPTCISVATKSGALRTTDDVQYILFDDDEVDFGSSDQAAAMAVCVKYLLDKRREMAIDDLVEDARLWRGGIWPGTGVRVNFFREHLQKRSFNGIIEVGKESLLLKLDHCKIELIRARPGSRA